ncbi:MAG: pyridoxal phosphate-dependent aminotransferase [Clostridia bacterium]|nr:pyridoxal phosphate-dependent aminotransferase [Clostridia bacterium]
MINEQAYELGSKRSVIREIFEYAKKRGEEIGQENVFDFSIGNPSVPAPAKVNETIERLLRETPSVALHGYTSAQGDKEVRAKIAANLNFRFGVGVSADNLYMTCGAAASLCAALHAICQSGDEMIVFAPYFTEYKVFVEGAGAKLVTVGANADLLPSITEFERAITPKTKGVIVNSPNNPSGVVYGEKTLQALAAVLRKKQEEYGAPIYLISDEPYRELVYDGEAVPFPMNYYENTLSCYSWSKALSLPGERIGYVAVSPKAKESEKLYAAVCGAGRKLGYVCAPALFQRVAAECDGLTGDLSVYKRNRDLLYAALKGYGFSCVYPSGAFYLFMQSPEADAYAFCERAKKYELLFVPSDDFGLKSYVRIAYCVDTETIKRALPKFKELAKEYGL